jgi:hypothetical protein
MAVVQGFPIFLANQIAFAFLCVFFASFALFADRFAPLLHASADHSLTN